MRAISGRNCLMQWNGPAVWFGTKRFAKSRRWSSKRWLCGAMFTNHHCLHLFEYAPVLGQLGQGIHGLVADALRVVKELEAACACLKMDKFVTSWFTLCFGAKNACASYLHAADPRRRNGIRLREVIRRLGEIPQTRCGAAVAPGGGATLQPEWLKPRSTVIGKKVHKKEGNACIFTGKDVPICFRCPFMDHWAYSVRYTLKLRSMITFECM